LIDSNFIHLDSAHIFLNLFSNVSRNVVLFHDQILFSQLICLVDGVESSEVNFLFGRQNQKFISKIHSPCFEIICKYTFKPEHQICIHFSRGIFLFADVAVKLTFCWIIIFLSVFNNEIFWFSVFFRFFRSYEFDLIEISSCIKLCIWSTGHSETEWLKFICYGSSDRLHFFAIFENLHAVLRRLLFDRFNFEEVEILILSVCIKLNDIRHVLRTIQHHVKLVEEQILFVQLHCNLVANE
jgi:hypothetical protein